MRDASRVRFLRLIGGYEGVCAYPYLDVKCLVTTAEGVLIDPIEIAYPLEWQMPDGTRATREQVALDWYRVKDRPDLAPHGGSAFEHLTTIRLTDDGIKKAVDDKLAWMESVLLERFPDHDSLWPEAAETALYSISWAAGPAWKAPKFTAAALDMDFDTAADECAVHTPRDAVNAQLFREAARELAVTQQNPIVSADDAPIFIPPEQLV